MREFDPPIFKVLAHNDTGAAAGHQGGVVIPKDLEGYFPQISGITNAQNPTAERELIAELFLGLVKVAIVKTRYQYQTWGGSRSPERRLTANLGDIRKHASADDILLFEKSANIPDYYRIRLIRKSDTDFGLFKNAAGNRRWGVLDPKSNPISEVALLEAETHNASVEAAPFSLFDKNPIALTSQVTRIARSRAFSMRINRTYGYQCAACQNGLRTPAGGFEVEAAHIVPRRLGGSDDARNGFALCKSHHWAFDEGLWTVDANRQVQVSSKALALAANTSLKALSGNVISSPVSPTPLPHLDALEWHRKYAFLG